MPDIGMSELLFIVLVTLIVIGPEKMPEAMRGLGRTIGKVRRFWHNMTADIRRELELEALREEVLKQKEEIRRMQEEWKNFTNTSHHHLTSINDLTEIGHGRAFNLK